MKIECTVLLLIEFLFCTISVSAQSWLWGAQGVTGLKADLFARNVATNKTSNVYQTGAFKNSLTFGTYTLTSSGIDDIYLVKYDSNGNVLWATQSQSPPDSKTFARSVATDDSDNSYITGYTGDTSIFGADTLTSKSQGFLVKYNSNGVMQWLAQTPFNAINKTGGYAVTTDRFGHEYLTGAGAYLIKFDRNGNTLWDIPQTIRYYGADSINNTGLSVVTDGFGNVFMAGQFSDSIKFGNYTLYSAHVGAFIAKFDSNGNVLWAQQSTHTPYTVQTFNSQPPLYALAADPSGAVYLTSAFSDSVQFGSHIFASVDSLTFSFFVIKFNPGGSIAWGEQATTISDSNGWGSYSICADDSYHIYISGAKSTAGLTPYSFVLRSDTITTDYNSYDAPTFLIKLDSSGYALCGSTLEGGGLESNAVACDPTGKYVYIGGGFNFSFKVGTDSLTVNHSGYAPYTVRWQSCAKCIVTTSPPSQAVCYGHTIALKASGGAGWVNYTWSPTATLTTSTGDSVLASPTTSTTYTVTATGGNCNNVSSHITINVIPSPVKPSFTQHGDTLISSSKYDNQWYRNDSLLQNDTTQYLIISLLGEYVVNVLNEANGCSTSSDSIDISSLTSTGQLITGNSNIKVYPNPTSGILTINSANTPMNDIEITNVLGQPILNFLPQSADNKIAIDMSGLSNGMYFIIITNKTTRGVFSVLKLN